MSEGLTDLSLSEAGDRLAKHEVTAEALTGAHLAAVEAARELNIFVCETPERALEQARASDARRARGAVLGPLDGIPVAVKDLFCTEGVPTTAGSHILEGFTATYESTVSAKLASAGAIMVGKNNMDEFAMGSSNATSYFGPVKNPWRGKRGKDLVPGGSSGGSAAAVAARTCLAAIGTDTGGSIRQPASLCGVVGMKPTYGRCSRWGIVAFASSLDQAGPITRTVRDAAIVLGVIAGHDPKDSTSARIEVPDFEAALRAGDVKGLKVGIPREYRIDGTPAEIEELWERGADWLRDAGASVEEISLLHTEYALPAYYIVAPAEASSNLARYDGVRFGLRVPGETLDEMYENTRGRGFGPEVRRRVMIGTYVLSAGYYDAYYVKAQRVRTLIARDFHQAFERVDVVLTPTTPSAAFPIGEKMDDPIAMYLNDVFTVPANLSGLPGISVPAGLDADGLPLGLHLVGRPFDEETVLRAAQALENAAEFSGLPDFVEARR